MASLIFFFSFVVLLWLSVTKTALNLLSWGGLRRLEHKHAGLEKQIGKWIENRNRYIQVINFLSLSLLSLTVTVLWKYSFRHIEFLKSAHADILIALTFATALIMSSGFISSRISFKTSCRLLKFSVPLLGLFGFLFLPVFVFSQKITADAEQSETTSVEDEILSLVEQDAYTEDEKQQAGLEADERKMIRGIFDLDDTLVREIMTPRVDIKGVEVESELNVVKQKIIESGHSRLPVYSESLDEIVGIVYAKDLLDETKVKDNTLADILHKPSYIPESKNIGDLLDELRLNKQHLAVIIDEYGGTSGIVTIEDILEEIVGEIQDEFDTEEEIKNHEFNEDGSIDLEGRFYIDEFNELMSASLEEDEDFDTLAGFITNAVGRIPQTGENLKLSGFLFKITEADERKITKIQVIKVEES